MKNTFIDVKPEKPQTLRRSSSAPIIIGRTVETCVNIHEDHYPAEKGDFSRRSEDVARSFAEMPSLPYLCYITHCLYLQCNERCQFT